MAALSDSSARTGADEVWSRCAPACDALARARNTNRTIGRVTCSFAYWSERCAIVACREGVRQALGRAASSSLPDRRSDGAAPGFELRRDLEREAGTGIAAEGCYTAEKAHRRTLPVRRWVSPVFAQRPMQAGQVRDARSGRRRRRPSEVAVLRGDPAPPQAHAHCGAPPTRGVEQIRPASQRLRRSKGPVWARIGKRARSGRSINSRPLPRVAAEIGRGDSPKVGRRCALLV